MAQNVEAKRMATDAELEAAGLAQVPVVEMEMPELQPQVDTRTVPTLSPARPEEAQDVVVAQTIAPESPEETAEPEDTVVEAIIAPAESDRVADAAIIIPEQVVTEPRLAEQSADETQAGELPNHPVPAEMALMAVPDDVAHEPTGAEVLQPTEAAPELSAVIALPGAFDAGTQERALEERAVEETQTPTPVSDKEAKRLQRQQEFEETVAALDPRTRGLLQLVRNKTGITYLAPAFLTETELKKYLSPAELTSFETAESMRASTNIVPDNASALEAAPTQAQTEQTSEVPASFIDVVDSLKALSSEIDKLAQTNEQVAAVKDDLVLKDTTLAALQEYARQAEAEGYTPKAEGIPLPSITYTGLTKDYVKATFYAQYLIDRVQARMIEEASKRLGDGEALKAEKANIANLLAPYSQDVAVEPDHLQALQDALSGFTAAEFQHAGIMSDPEGNVLGIVGIEPQDAKTDAEPASPSETETAIAQEFALPEAAELPIDEIPTVKRQAVQAPKADAEPTHHTDGMDAESAALFVAMDSPDFSEASHADPNKTNPLMETVEPETVAVADGIEVPAVATKEDRVQAEVVEEPAHTTEDAEVVSEAALRAELAAQAQPASESMDPIQDLVADVVPAPEVTTGRQPGALRRFAGRTWRDARIAWYKFQTTDRNPAAVAFAERKLAELRQDQQ